MSAIVLSDPFIVVDPVPGFQNFYKMDDDGEGFLIDTAGNQNLTNSNATQVTVPPQGEMARFTASPTNQGLSDMGWPAGDVDKSITCVFKTDSIDFESIFSDVGTPFSDNYISFAGNNSIDVVTPLSFANFAVPTLNTSDRFGLIVTFTSDFVCRLYINGIESTSGAKALSDTLDLSVMANADSTDTFADFLGDLTYVRIYAKTLSTAEVGAIDTADRK